APEPPCRRSPFVALPRPHEGARFEFHCSCGQVTCCRAPLKSARGRNGREWLPKLMSDDSYRGTQPVAADRQSEVSYALIGAPWALGACTPMAQPGRAG